MSELLQSGQHPDADQLSAFIEHALPAHEREQTLAHLAICSHCRRVVALSRPPAEELPAPHREPVRRPWLSGWNLAWAAAAALAALVLAGIYIRNGIVAPSHAPATQTAQSLPPAPPRQEEPAPRLRQLLPGAKPQKPSAAPVPDPGAGTDDRNIRRREALAASAPTGKGGATGAQLSSAIKVAAANQTMLSTSPVGGLAVTDQAQTAHSIRALPSGLRALSTVSNGRRLIAIDTQNTLFSSDDAGAHWNIVREPWQGHAVKLELVSSSYSAGTRPGAAAPAPAPVAGGMEPRDALEGPKASISGEVTEPSGASIANVSVSVTNVLTQAARKTTTDSAGRYSIDGLEPGNYTVAAEAPGFPPQQVSGVALIPAQQSQKNLTLAVGSLSQSVEVQGSPQRALAAPRVNEKIATGGTTPPQSFQITTDMGERWTSTDGRSWKRQD